MTDDDGSVGWVFERPAGTVRLPDTGQWWATRENVRLEDDGTVTVVFGDGTATVRINGTPATLGRVADAITAHVESAIINSGQADERDG